MDISALNEQYRLLNPKERLEKLFADYDKIVFTSSFGTTAAYLLHLINQIKPDQPIYFLDTTYHFAETIEYKKQLTEQFNLKVVDILPETWKNEFTRKDETWTKDQDLCCSINKVEPMDRLKEGQKLWISGLLSYQNKHRKELPIFEQKSDIIKFYPIIDVTEQEMEQYYIDNNIPKHPLQAQGYDSIGCAQCTVKGKGREGRWTNTSKTECGLHL